MLRVLARLAETGGNTVNHDMTHCADYRKSYCPERCFRARLTQELLERHAAGEDFGPVCFAHLRGTDECRRRRHERVH